jgi:hypothetical protein
MKKRKANNHRARALRGLKGLMFSWKDTDPLPEGDHTVTDVKASHVNPVFRLDAATMILQYNDLITDRLKLDWEIEITVVSVYPDGLIQREIRELFARNTIFNDINETAKESIKDAMRHSGGKYLTTEFSVKCLGINSEIRSVA